MNKKFIITESDRNQIKKLYNITVLIKIIKKKY